MGRTWKYKTMFDLDMEEDSFGDILYNAGIEVVAVDWDRNDDHQMIFQKCRELVNRYNPDFIMGYCYGCFVCGVLPNNKTKHIFLLDPSAEVSQQKDFVPEFLPLMEKDLTTKNIRLDAKLPPIPFDKIKCGVTIFKTRDCSVLDQPNRMQVKYIKNKTIVDLPEASHYILIEPARYDLANRILEIMNA